MAENICSGPFIDYPPKWSILFAQDVDQDLDFDEGLEDDELDHHKPPRRRPLLWIFILLLAVGVVYWALQPDFSIFTGTNSSSNTISQPRLTIPGTGQQEAKPLPGITVPSPKFREGQNVLLVQKSGDKALSATLQGNSSGTKSGPIVKVGEPLTILDGEMVGAGWVYKVRTQSGATGWVLENAIRTNPS